MSEKRHTPLTDIFLENQECFTPEQIEKIKKTQPKGKLQAHAKCEFGAVVERVVKPPIP